MSITRAILFYSKYEPKGFRMKNIIDSLQVDVNTVCVDSSAVREMLQNDDTYNITLIPTVLILYSNKDFKLYTNKNLDLWFNQLIENVQKYYQSESQIQTTSIDFEPSLESQIQEEPIVTNVPKELRRKQGDASNIRTSLPSPGKHLLDDDTPSITPSQASLIAGHINGGNPLVDITSPPQLKNIQTGVKSSGASAKEIADQMVKQKDELEKYWDDTKPLLP
jgi:hypothetical protein